MAKSHIAAPANRPDLILRAVVCRDMSGVLHAPYPVRDCRGDGNRTLHFEPGGGKSFETSVPRASREDARFRRRHIGLPSRRPLT